MRRRAFGLLATFLVVAGCAAGGARPYGSNAPYGVQPGAGQAPIGPGGQGGGGHVALLLPLTGPNAPIGQAMLNAARLALDSPGAPPLDPIDTAATPDGAAQAARQAVANGAGLILGPLTSGDTAAAARVARQAGVPMLAFTNDPSQAQPGVWTLGITPGQQVHRLAAAAHAEGHSRFAALVPDSPLGNAMADALSQAASQLSLQPPTIQRYSGGFGQINQAARAVSDYADRRGPIDAQIKAARATLNAEGRRKAADLAKTPVPPPPFDTLLLADIGEPLQEIMSLLPYYDVFQPTVELIGPATWEGQAGHPAGPYGGRFAAPDPASRAAFDSSYAAKFGAPAPRIADLAYDAAAIARVTAAEGGFSAQSLTRPQGFAGTDGVLALMPDGHVRRGLAIFEVDRDGAHIVDPAPTTLTAPGA